MLRAFNYGYFNQYLIHLHLPGSHLNDVHRICMIIILMRDNVITHLNDVLVGERLVGFIVLRVLEEDLVHVRGGALVQLVARAEDDQRDLTVAQHWQLVRLLHHAKLAFVKRHLKYFGCFKTLPEKFDENIELNYYCLSICQKQYLCLKPQFQSLNL